MNDNLDQEKIDFILQKIYEGETQILSQLCQILWIYESVQYCALNVDLLKRPQKAIDAFVNKKKCNLK